MVDEDKRPAEPKEVNKAAVAKAASVAASRDGDGSGVRHVYYCCPLWNELCRLLYLRLYLQQFHLETELDKD